MNQRVAAEPKPKYIYSGIKEGSVGIVFGPSKSGKTIFCENLLQSIASGQDSFLGMSISIENRKVLMVSFEEYYTFRTERQAMQIQKQMTTLGDEWVDNFMVNDEHLPTYIRSEEDWKVLRDFIIESEVGIVVLDSITRMCEGIEESSNAQTFTRRLKDLALKTKTTIIAIHHATKLNGAPLTMDSIAGSRVIAQELDFAIGINRTPDGKRYLKDVFFRYAQADDEAVRAFAIDANCWLSVIARTNEMKMLAGLDGRRDDSKTNLMFEHIEAQAKAGKEILTTREIEASFVDTKLMSKPTMYAHLEKLEDDRKIIKCGRGEYKLAA
jgi:archaellum biogenesis ATPase FlaH